MRQFTVTDSDGQEAIYDGFDANGDRAHFRLVPLGMVHAVEGSFYCDEVDIERAVHSCGLYNREVFGRPEEVSVFTMDGMQIQ